MKQKQTIIMVILCAAVIALGGATVNGYMTANRYKTNLDYNYQRAMNDLGDCVENIESTLTKGIYANTATQQNGLAAKLMRETSMAKAALAVLPVGDNTLDTVNKYIAQVGDFAMSLSNKVSAGQKITDEEYQTLQELGKYASSLKKNLSEANPDFSSEAVGESFQQTAEDFTDFPSLIYDGPFSDHIMQMTSRMVEGMKELTKEEAQDAAAKFLGMNSDELTPAEDTAGNLPTYNFSGESVRISLTKQGGLMSNFINSREIGEQKIDYAAASKKARAFLEQHGYPNMKESYYAISDGICTINYAYEMDGVTCYPDLVKVAVAMDLGDIVEMNATGYIMNHTERDLSSRTLTVEQAQEKVSPRLTVRSSGVALIPTPGLDEVLTYEFACTGQNDEEVLVYINCNTGYEEQIYILQKSDNGILVK